MDDILYLEPDEEITSVIDKLSQLEGKRVCLVLPKNAQLASSVVNLKLLSREAERLKKAISVVTQDPVGMSLAAQVGLPVYASPNDSAPIAPAARPRPEIDDVIDLAQGAAPAAEESPVPVRRYDVPVQPTSETKNSQVVPQRPAASHTTSSDTRTSLPVLTRRGRKVLLGLAIALLTGLAGWFFFLYPRATIVLSVASDPIQEAVSVVVDNNISEPDEATGHIPGQKVQVEDSVKESFEATGTKDVGTKAVGSVTVSNRLGESVTVPAGSTLVRDDTTVVTTEAVTVNAATVSLDASGNVSVNPGSTKVAVEAQSPGSEGNLAPGDFVITNFTGSKREKVTASNSTALAGGESRTIKVVTEDDISAARTAVLEKTKEQLAAKVSEQAKGLTVIANSIDVELIESSPSKQAGDEADTFELSAKLRARTIGFAAADYQAMVTKLVSAKLPEGKELVVTQEDSVETAIEGKDYPQGTLALKATLRTEVVQKIDEDSLKRLVAGKTAIQAETALKEQAGIVGATVSLRPAFRSSIPGAERQITISLTRE